jgi:hypothetical protein
VCKEPFELDNLDNILTPEETEKLQNVLLRCALQDVEEAKAEGIITCPFCEYVEITEKKAGECLVFQCKNMKCHKKTCTICKKEYMPDDDSHLQCLEMQDIKAELDEAIEKGSKRTCPKCGYSGVKDEACSHINCPKCKRYFCYVCGLYCDDCPGTYGDGGFGEHNENWQEDEQRCPMYMYEIQGHDERWPGDEVECIAFLHTKLCLQNLKAIVQKYRESRQIELLRKVDRIYNYFAQFETSIEDIDNVDTTLIRRGQPQPEPEINEPAPVLEPIPQPVQEPIPQPMQEQIAQPV